MTCFPSTKVQILTPEALRGTWQAQLDALAEKCRKLEGEVAAVRGAMRQMNEQIDAFRKAESEKRVEVEEVMKERNALREAIANLRLGTNGLALLLHKHKH